MAEPATTAGGRERVEKAAKLFEEAFRDDPVITYQIAGMGAARVAYLRIWFERVLTAAAMNDAIFHDAGDWMSCGCLLPPGCRVDNPFTMIQAGFFSLLWNVGLQGIRRMLLEYSPLTDKCKEKALRGQKRYYYIFLVATREPGRGKGLCSALMRRYQEMGSRDGVPVFVEATTEKSMKLYQKLGWELVEEIVLGKGTTGPDGLPCNGGEGVKFWGMIWWPTTARRIQKKEGIFSNWGFWLSVLIALGASLFSMALGLIKSKTNV